MKHIIGPMGIDYHRLVGWTFLKTMYQKYIEKEEGHEDLHYYVGMCECDDAQESGMLMPSQAQTGHCGFCGRHIKYHRMMDMPMKRREWRVGQTGVEEEVLQETR